MRRRQYNDGVAGKEPLDYASEAPPRRPLSAKRTILAVVGFAWFGLFAFLAVVFFVARGFADEPGHLMTVPRALKVSGTLLAIGLPGLAAAIAALRLGR